MNDHFEEGNLVESCDPDWEQIERDLFPGGQNDDELRAEAGRIAFLMTQHVLGWVLKGGMNNPNGIAIRSIVIGWLTLPVLKPLTLTQLALSYGFSKQSIDRWVVKAKAELPHLKNQHMQN